MRFRFATTLPIIVCAMLMFATVGAAAVDPFTVTISVPSQSIKAGDDVRVHLVVTNTSNHAIWVPRSPGEAQAEMHNLIQVRTSDNQDAPLTDYGHAVKERGFSGSVLKVLLPHGDKLEEETQIGKQFDLTAPRDYLIQFSRPVSGDPKDGFIQSNKLKITVTP